MKRSVLFYNSIALYFCHARTLNEDYINETKHHTRILIQRHWWCRARRIVDGMAESFSLRNQRVLPYPIKLLVS